MDTEKARNATIEYYEEVEQGGTVLNQFKEELFLISYTVVENIKLGASKIFALQGESFSLSVNLVLNLSQDENDGIKHTCGHGFESHLYSFLYIPS